MFQMGLLELSGFSPDLDILNELSYRLTLSDPATHRLQSLNWSWAQASARAVETYRSVQEK